MDAAYLEILRQRAGRSSMSKTAEEKPLVLERLKRLYGENLGKTSKDGKDYVPLPPTTMTSIGNQTTQLPTTKPKVMMLLLSNAKVSPTIAIGTGGLQFGILVRRRPKEVPPTSIVGKGLDNQNSVSSGASVIVEPEPKAG